MLSVADNAPLTLFLISSSNGFVCSESSSSSPDVMSSEPLLSSSLVVVSTESALSSDSDESVDSLPLSLSSLEVDSSSLLPANSEAGVIDVVFCAKTKFWLKSIVLIMIVDNTRIADNVPNFTCWVLINFFSTAAAPTSLILVNSDLC